jgi:CrcB protein
MKAVWVMLGGSVGALVRYATALLCARLFGTGYPAGTLTVNLVGCFLIGVAMALAERNAIVTPTVRLFFVTGFLGALTTFSTYAWESTSALRSGAVGMAAANLLANNVAGLALVVAGFWVARR